MGDAAALAIDRWFAAWAMAWTVVALLGFGLISAVIPNPVFGRQVPPEPFAIAVWLASAPLMGLVGATYSAPVRPAGPASVLGPVMLGSGVLGSGAPARPVSTAEGRTSTVGVIGSVGAFLAIGCPVCNKIALVLLGTSGAMSVYAPLQPIIGAVSLVLLGGTVAWRFRLRATGASCGI